ncbi:MAG: hypothetical protein QW735_03310 [archaeon]
MQKNAIIITGTKNKIFEDINERIKRTKEIAPLGVLDYTSFRNINLNNVALVIVLGNALTEEEFRDLSVKSNIQNFKVITYKGNYSQLHDNIYTVYQEDVLINTLDSILSIIKSSTFVKDITINQKIIGFLNTKGGIGTTTASITLALYATIKYGIKSILVDASTIRGDILTYLISSGLVDPYMQYVKISSLIVDYNMSKEEYEVYANSFFASKDIRIANKLSFIAGIDSSHEAPQGDKISQIQMFYEYLLSNFQLIFVDLGNQLNSPFIQAGLQLSHFYPLYVTLNTMTCVKNFASEFPLLIPQQYSMVLPIFNKGETIDDEDEYKAFIGRYIENKAKILPIFPYDKDLLDYESNKISNIETFINTLSNKYGKELNSILKELIR